MSLSDRYQRGDGRLALLDRHLTHLGDRAGTWFADRTGAGRQPLTHGLYLAAAAAAVQHVVLVRDPGLLAVAGVALLSLRGLVASRGGLVEQIQVEAAGLPRNTLLVMRLAILGMGLLSLLTAVAYLVETLRTGVPLPVAAAESALSGVALFALQAADYIRRTNPVTPSGGHRMRI
jgi:hypothetical protein